MIDVGDVGILIDRSHGSALDLDLAVISYAMEIAQFELDGDYPYERDGIDDGDYADIIRDYADSAVDYMNHKIAGENVVFVIDDNSLFLEKIGE